MNIWRRFRDLIPGDPLLVGTVASHNADGTSSITLPDGSLIRARGQGVAVASRAFVRAGVVEGEAPTLPVEVIEI